jgi:hypothetical protein
VLRAWPSELRCRVGTGLTVNSLALPVSTARFLFSHGHGQPDGRMHTNRQASTSGSMRSVHQSRSSGQCGGIRIGRSASCQVSGIYAIVPSGPVTPWENCERLRPLAVAATG